MLSSIGIATETVLGRENRHDVHTILKHQIQRVLVAHHTRLIAQQSHTFALQQRHILVSSGCPQHHLAGGHSGCNGLSGIGMSDISCNRLIRPVGAAGIQRRHRRE